jgi:hypothetical protein
MRKVLATLAVVAAGASTVLAGSPAQASSLVPVVLSVHDTDGNPLAQVPFYVQSGSGLTSFSQWATTGSNGTATVDAIPNATAVVTMDSGGGISATDMSSVTYVGGSLIDANGGVYHPTVATGATGATLPITMPRVVQRDIRVVNEAGDPIAGADVSPLGLISPLITGADSATYRVTGRGMQFGADTDTDGRVHFTSWEQETDPAHADSSYFQNGEPTAGVIHFNPTVSGRLAQWMPYSALLDASTEIVLPYVPVIASPTTTAEPTAGMASVSATVLQPDSSGHRTAIAGRTVEFWSEPEATSASTATPAPRLLARAKSNAAGRVTANVSVGSSTRVAVHLQSTSHVPAVVTAHGRRADSLAATTRSTRVGRAAALPLTSRAGLAVTWRSTTPKVCSVAASTVRGLRAGTCKLAATTRGNATYGTLTVLRSIAVKR